MYDSFHCFRFVRASRPRMWPSSAGASWNVHARPLNSFAVTVPSEATA
jgi:hypothetical protein